MFENKINPERIILAGVHTGCTDSLSDTTEETIAELEELVNTAGGEAVGTIIQNRPSPDNATYLGEGKLDELKNAVTALECDCIVFDDELTPAQVKNISDATGVKVLDRTTLILDIFAARARTKEGKIQVELAQLRYMLPRLIGYGTALSRLGGGIGTRGPGETKLETDRRHIRRRIEYLSAELSEIRKHRDLLRSRRKKNAMTVCALVGYTNAGKSTLLNRLCDADVYAEDKLFATLDPTIRMLTLPDSTNVMLSDTVGFIRKLPHHLVEAFKSTLEEAVFADVLIHVIDASNPEYLSHIQITNQILDQIGASGKPTVAVLNKSDLAGCDVIPHVDRAAKTLCVSALTGEGMEELTEAISEAIPDKKRIVKFLIPYKDSSVCAFLHEEQSVIKEEYLPDATLIEAAVDAVCYEKLRKYVKRD